MADSTTNSGSYRLIVERDGTFVSQSIADLGESRRPTIEQLQNHLPALGLPKPGVEFALLWSSNDDPEMNLPVLVASPSVTMKWADYYLERTEGESFVDYLNRGRTVLVTGESEEEVTVDILQFMLNRHDMLAEESMNRVIRPPSANSVEYEQLVTRPGEIFMLLLYVEKHLSYHLVTRHPDIIPLYEELRTAQADGRVSTEWFNTWWGKLEPVQMGLVANNSDKGLLGLVSDLERELAGTLPNDLQEEGIFNLKELADIRNTIGHSTIYNGMVVDGKTMIVPHVTKHTGRLSRQTFSTQFDDEIYTLIKSMIEDAHTFLMVCAKTPTRTGE